MLIKEENQSFEEFTRTCMNKLLTNFSNHSDKGCSLTISQKGFKNADLYENNIVSLEHILTDNTDEKSKHTVMKYSGVSVGF